MLQRWRGLSQSCTWRAICGGAHVHLPLTSCAAITTTCVVHLPHLHCAVLSDNGANRTSASTCAPTPHTLLASCRGPQADVDTVTLHTMHTTATTPPIHCKWTRNLGHDHHTAAALPRLCLLREHGEITLRQLHVDASCSRRLHQEPLPAPRSTAARMAPPAPRASQVSLPAPLPAPHLWPP